MRPIDTPPRLARVLFAIAAGAPMPLVAAAEPSASIADADRAAICGTRTTCDIEQLQSAGYGANGAALTVATVNLGVTDKPEDAPDDGCGGYGEKDGGSEYWLLEEGQPPRRVLSLCFDGYGSAGVGEDHIEVGPNHLSHTQSGGSAWRWSTQRSLRLSPLALLESETRNYHVSADSARGSSTRLIELEPELIVRHYAPTAVAIAASDGGVQILEAHREWQSTLGDVSAGISVPMVDVDAHAAGADLRAARGYTLAGCHARIAANGAPGYLVWGRANPARHDEVRAALLGSDVLVLQIHAPSPDDPTIGWLGRDHVELWASSESAPDLWDTDASWPYRDAALIQLGITLDGALHAGVGAFPRPEVERWTAVDDAGRPVIVLRLAFAQPIADNGLVIVWSQAERARQARLSATTGINRNRPALLPPVYTLQGGCRLQDGALRRGASDGDHAASLQEP